MMQWDRLTLGRLAKELSILVPTKEEESFWEAFSEGNYYPDLVFGDDTEFKSVAQHPMAIWKCRSKEG